MRDLDKIHVLICDDHPLFASGIKEILENHAIPCSTVHDFTSCKQFLSENKIDLFLCDLNIGGISGFDLIQNLRNELKQVRIYILSAYDEDYLIEKAENMKLSGFLTKGMSSEKLIELITDTRSTHFFSIKKRTDTNFETEFSDIESRIHLLSKQEKRIIQLVSKGMSSKEIGHELNISKTTVDTHRRNINKKLQVNSVGALVKLAHENQLTL